MIEKQYLRTCEYGKGNVYFSEYYTEDLTTIYRELATLLKARYISKAPWVKRIENPCYYDGLSHFNIYLDNGIKYEIVVKL